MAKMIYNALPKNPQVKLSAIGFGAAQFTDSTQTREVLEAGLEAGINFMDTLPSEAGGYAAMTDVIAPVRKDVALQLHLGCDYSSGKYGWTRDMDVIKRGWEFQLDAFKTDYADFGFIHCMDEVEDFEAMFENSLWDYALELKKQGVIKHLGCSTHSVEIGKRMVETGLMELMMFSINPMYDYTDESIYGKGGVDERAEFYRLCERENVALSVMKASAGGQLFSAEQSPFKIALTPVQCVQYAFDKPAVACVHAGMKDRTELEGWLSWLDATAEQKDYSALGSIVPQDLTGRCVYCSHCHPCPAGLDIAMINKYYDLSLLGDEQARGHYEKLELHASDCIACGHCDSRCPFDVAQQQRMEEIAGYFGF